MAFNIENESVIDSSKTSEDVWNFIFDISHYVLFNDVEFKDGQTCSLSWDEKIKIKFSKENFSQKILLNWLTKTKA